jgi:cobalamin biosynthesis protein CobD/CbiB
VNRYGTDTEDRPLLGAGSAAEPGDIGRAVKLSEDVTSALALLLAAVGMALTVRGRVSRRWHR